MNKLKAIATGAVLTAAPLLATVSASASPVSHIAPHAASVQTFHNQATNACLDDSAAYGLRAAACTTSSTQKWSVSAVPNYRMLKNVSTGRCVDDSLHYGLRAVSCNGLAYQQWFVKHWNDGTFRFQNHNTGRCIDDSGKGLRPIACNSTPYQSWF